MKYLLFTSLKNMANFLIVLKSITLWSQHMYEREGGRDEGEKGRERRGGRERRRERERERRDLTCEHRVSAAEASPIPTENPVTLIN